MATETDGILWVVPDYAQGWSWLTKILWTNEATFKTNGRVNWHNCVYWSDKNPHCEIKEELCVPGITIWAEGVFGPLFIKGTVNAE